MSDPFLVLPGTKRRRTRNTRDPGKPTLQAKGTPRRKDARDEKKQRMRDRSQHQAPGDTDDDEIGPGGIEDSDVEIEDVSEESEAEETLAERRLRLAKGYLDRVRAEAAAEFDAEAIDRDIIAQRLQEDVAESKGKVYKHIAGKLCLSKIGKPIPHRHPVTCVAQHGTNFYTGSKDGIIEKWDIKYKPERLVHVNRRRNKKDLSGHTDDVLSMAISGDGKFLATAGQDRRICIWDTASMKHLKTFTQHRGPVMGLACRPSSNQLYSASSDRTVKLWSMNDLSYIETLFGHQDAIPSIASFHSERCVSVGARDRSARVWKIIDETQLVYQIPKEQFSQKPQPSQGEERFPEGSMDYVAVIDEQHFITGGDNGDIILWSLNKKKPQFVQRLAHGVDAPLTPERASAEMLPEGNGVPPQPRWITSLVSVPYTDVFFSGSWDGRLGMWKVSEDLRKFELLRYIEFGIKGVVNGISVQEVGKRGGDGVQVILALGTEVRLGRWQKVKGGKNCNLILKFGFQ